MTTTTDLYVLHMIRDGEYHGFASKAEAYHHILDAFYGETISEDDFRLILLNAEGTWRDITEDTCDMHRASFPERYAGGVKLDWMEAAE